MRTPWIALAAAALLVPLLLPTAPASCHPLCTQNDAKTGGDASNVVDAPTNISVGASTGWLQAALIPSLDPRDAFGIFVASNGTALHVALDPVAQNLRLRLVAPDGIVHKADQQDLAGAESILIPYAVRGHWKVVAEDVTAEGPNIRPIDPPPCIAVCADQGQMHMTQETTSGIALKTYSLRVDCHPGCF